MRCANFNPHWNGWTQTVDGSGYGIYIYYSNNFVWQQLLKFYNRRLNLIIKKGLLSCVAAAAMSIRLGVGDVGKNADANVIVYGGGASFVCSSPPLMIPSDVWVSVCVYVGHVSVCIAIWGNGVYFQCSTRWILFYNKSDPFHFVVLLVESKQVSA